MKKHLINPQLLKSIATHSLVAAIFSQPWLVSFWSDIVAIASGSSEALLRDQMINAMSLVSTVAFLVAVVSFVLYLLYRRSR